MTEMAMKRKQFDGAEGHCHRRLAHSKRLGVEGKDKIFEALQTYITLRELQLYIVE
jgi:hypothetical protein